MNKIITYIIFGLFLFACSGPKQNCYAFTPRFQYLTTADGLSQNTVDCIFRDGRGFMWFGTWNGLCRYDGYNFRNYQKDDSENGLPSNFIRTICEDQHENLWVGTTEGIVLYSLDKEQFFLPEPFKSIFRYIRITDLYCNNRGIIWVGTENNGLYTIRISEKESELPNMYTYQVLPDKRFSGQTINEIYQKKDGEMLVGTTRGLYAVWDDKVQVIDLSLVAENPRLAVTVLSIWEAENEDLWVGTETGAFQKDSVSGKWLHYGENIDEQGGVSHNTVLSISEDIKGNILIGTLGGLDIYNPTTKNFSHIDAKGKTFNHLNNEFVNSLYADQAGNVWVGTEKGGVNRYSVFQKPFYSLLNEPGNPSSLSHNTVNSILIDGNTLWVGTAGGGLNRVDERIGRIEHFRYIENDPRSLNSDFVTSICQDHSNRLWIGTWGGGISQLTSERNKTFENHLSLPGISNCLINNFVSCIFNDPRGFLAIGTLGGFDLYDPTKRKYFHLKDILPVNFDVLEVGCILQDRKDNYWIGTRKGLLRIASEFVDFTPGRLNDSDFDFFLHKSNDSLSIPGDYVISLLEDREGSIWIGTYGNGICKAISDSVGKIHFHSYSTSDGLCNNVAYAMEEDQKGNIWISTDNGLAKFDSKKNEFHSFYVKDGLLSDQFYWSASASGKDGRLYFGGVEGLNYFHPDHIDYYPQTSPVAFTNFLLFNESVNIGEKYHGRVLLSNSISKTKSIELSHKDNVFSIEFSALDYFLPEKVMYAYKMEGVDQDWVTTSASRRFVSYTNLSGGEYNFQVKASNSDGVWNEVPSELKFIIHPPFWKTNWFIIVSIAFIALLVMAYIHYRTLYLQEQKRKLEKQVRDRTEKIEEQKEKLQEQAERLQQSNEELSGRQVLIENQKIELEKSNRMILKQRDEVIELNEKVKQISQLRLKFFTNISHEFRTPLTLILDPLESLLNNLKSDDPMTKTLMLINRNARRLMHLIDQLMNFRKIETGKIELRVVRGNVVDFLREIFDSFHDLAKKQKIDFRFSTDQAPEQTWFDSEKMENIFYNLLSNAFRYTPKNGKISMHVSFHTPGPDDQSISFPYLQVEVNDSGKGIAKEQLSYIFDRFYQAGKESEERKIGSGIGLALTQELVTALHGKIQVDSEINKGSSFKVCLPYLSDDFTQEELDYTGSRVELTIQGKVDVIEEELLHQDNEEDEVVDNSDKSKPLILIVEDNYDLRNFLVQTLKSDYRVIGAPDGKEGFLAAKKYTPDIVVSDIMMPVMDGIELCKRLKKELQTSHIPVVLLTAKALVENLIEGLETGADDYIPKPFNLNVLQLKIRNLIESRKKLRQLFTRDTEPTPAEVTTNSIDEQFISQAYVVLEEQYQQPDFSIEQYARKMLVSKSLLYKKIKAITGYSITDFINLFKLKKATAMLAENPERSISEISYDTGFNDPKYFSRVFKKVYGMSPSEYLKNLRN